MADKPFSLAFNIPFELAITAARERGVVLPEIYYGQLQGIARQRAFSIAWIASLDQLQAVQKSLSDYMANGGSYKEWQKEASTQSMNLPAHRLDNIWRTNLQGNYMRGKYEQMTRNSTARPYWLYDAINDSRVRASHLAMDGMIRRWDDPIWNTWYPPAGYRCRCSVISLTEAQARIRSGWNQDGTGNGINKIPLTKDNRTPEPDAGFDYNPASDKMGTIPINFAKYSQKLKEVAEDVAEIADAIPAVIEIVSMPQQPRETVLTRVRALLPGLSLIWLEKLIDWLKTEDTQ